jgi:hypothetical protein
VSRPGDACAVSRWLRASSIRPELVELSQQLDDYVRSMHEHEAENAAMAEGAPASEPTASEPRPLPRLSDRVKSRQWHTAEGTPAFVTMITEGEELMPEPCSGIPVPRWGIAPLDADGNTGSFVVGPSGDPSALFDLEGDGQWELLVGADGCFSEPELLTITPDGFTALTALPSVSYWGLPLLIQRY